MVCCYASNDCQITKFPGAATSAVSTSLHWLKHKYEHHQTLLKVETLRNVAKSFGDARALALIDDRVRPSHIAVFSTELLSMQRLAEPIATQDREHGDRRSIDTHSPAPDDSRAAVDSPDG